MINFFFKWPLRFFLVLHFISCSTSSPKQPDISDAGDSGSAACDVSATTTYTLQTEIIAGTGVIHCASTSSLDLKVCLYSKSKNETSWGDPLECLTSAASGQTTLSSKVQISIALSSSKNYRTVVNAQVNSMNPFSQVSSIVTAPE